MKSSELLSNLLMLAALMLTVIDPVTPIRCYQCSYVDDISCVEKFDTDSTLRPTDCVNVFEPRFCIKTTGMFADHHTGELGTKRFCSSRDWGNYCEYIKRPGDKLEYRSCVYTCSQDGCNGGRLSATLSPLFVVATCALAVSLFV